MFYFFLCLVITIPRVSKGANGERIYDKIHYCYYCGKSFTKIGRHLQENHKSEFEIKSLVGLEKKKKDVQLDLPRFRSEFYYDMKVLKSGGEMVVLRRPRASDLVSYHDYIPFVYCLAFLTKQEMWRHLKIFLNKDNENYNNKNIVEQSEMLLCSDKYHNSACKELKALVLENMIRDLVKKRLILTYGSCLLGTAAGFKEINNILQHKE